MHRRFGRVVGVAVLVGSLVGVVASGSAVAAAKRPRHKKPQFSQNLADYVPATVDGMPVIVAGQSCPAGTQTNIGPNDPTPPPPPGGALIAASLCYPGPPPLDYAVFFLTQVNPPPGAGTLKADLDGQGPVVSSVTPVKVLGAPGYWYLFGASPTDPGTNQAVAEPRPGLQVSVRGSNVNPADPAAGKAQALAYLKAFLAAGKGRVKRLPPAATTTPST